jgi:hypothetical protein
MASSGNGNRVVKKTLWKAKGLHGPGPGFRVSTRGPGLVAQIMFGFGPGSNDSNQTLYRTFRALLGHSFFFFLQRKSYSLLRSSYARDTVGLRKQIPPT